MREKYLSYLIILKGVINFYYDKKEIITILFISILEIKK